MTTATNTTTSIPLNKLVPWDGNVRKTGAADDLEQLTASIAAVGLLQSLVVRKTGRGKFAVIAGQRRLLALSALAEDGRITADSPVPCHVVAGSADGAEISLTENVVRLAMHPADQFEAFRELINKGSPVADVAARFGVTENVVRKRLKLASVSPIILDAYRRDELTLEQVQAFAVTDDHAAQERVFTGMPPWGNDADDIRSALTGDDIPATDKRVTFVTLDAYEQAGGTVRRDLFSEGDDGVFILDHDLLDGLVQQKLEVEVEAVRAEGWKWVEAHPQLDYEARSQFERRYPEATPLSEDAAVEVARLSEEYDTLYDQMGEDDEEASARLEEIEARTRELDEDRERVYSTESLAIGGAIVTIGHKGSVEIVRGLVRPEDAPAASASPRASVPKGKPAFSAALVASLTAHRSAAISATLAGHPDTALAAVVHALAIKVFEIHGGASCLELSASLTRIRETCKGVDALQQARESWEERIPGQAEPLWQWCIGQSRDTLLELLAFCAASIVNAVQAKGDHTHSGQERIAHAGALASALSLDMTAWFTPTAENYFGRVNRTAIVEALTEARGTPRKRSWDKLKKSELAATAERETAGTGWLPQPLKA